VPNAHRSESEPAKEMRRATLTNPRHHRQRGVLGVPTALFRFPELGHGVGAGLACVFDRNFEVKGVVRFSGRLQLDHKVLILSISVGVVVEVF